MSAAVTLSLAQQPEHVLVADCAAADRFASLDATPIAELPVVYGGRRATLGDFFKVRGERSTTLRIEGELARVEGIGTAMAGGEIVIAGGAGRDVGVQMAGGRIDIGGDAGDNAGGARPGASRGMIGGGVGLCREAGAPGGAPGGPGVGGVAGDVERGAGTGMIAGTVV